MKPITIHRSLHPREIPRAHFKELNVPLIPLTPEPKPVIVPVKTFPAGKAYKTQLPYGYLRPALPGVSVVGR